MLPVPEASIFMLPRASAALSGGTIVFRHFWAFIFVFYLIRVSQGARGGARRSNHTSRKQTRTKRVDNRRSQGELLGEPW